MPGSYFCHIAFLGRSDNEFSVTSICPDKFKYVHTISVTKDYYHKIIICGESGDCRRVAESLSAVIIY